MCIHVFPYLILKTIDFYFFQVVDVWHTILFKTYIDIITNVNINVTWFRFCLVYILFCIFLKNKLSNKLFSHLLVFVRYRLRYVKKVIFRTNSRFHKLITKYTHTNYFFWFVMKISNTLSAIYKSLVPWKTIFSIRMNLQFKDENIAMC